MKARFALIALGACSLVRDLDRYGRDWSPACPSGALLCESFDEHPAAQETTAICGPTWTCSGAGTLDVDEAGADGSNALALVQTGPIGGGASLNAAVDASIAKRLTLAFDLLPELYDDGDPDASGGSALCIVQIGFLGKGSGRRIAAQLRVQRGAIQLIEYLSNDAQPAHGAAGCLTANEWQHVTLTLDLAQSTVSLVSNGVSCIQGSQALDPAWGSGGVPSLSLGRLFTQNPAAGTWRLHVDNVAVSGE